MSCIKLNISDVPGEGADEDNEEFDFQKWIEANLLTIMLIIIVIMFVIMRH